MKTKSSRNSQFVPSRFLLAGALVFMFAYAASAVPIRISQFVGMSSGNLGTVGSGEGWAGGTSYISVTAGSGSLDGTSLGLYTSAGDKVNIGYNSTANGLNTYNNFAVSGQFPPSQPTNIYYSFLYRFNTMTNMSSTFSNKIAQVNRLGSGTASYFEVHALTNTLGKIQVGVAKTNGTPVYSSTNIDVGQVFFVVIRQMINAGGNNDQIDLWIDPPQLSFSADETGVPTPDASTFDGAEDSGSSTGPGRFYIIAGVGANFDEFRVGNYWADVTPSAAACTPASFDASPTNVTVAEGIAATFSVTSSSSSPLYQWQVSTNAGASWQNISGALSPSYTTSPLQVSDDQKRYRCVATVSCGGGSTATSGVAVVTVVPAVPTPVGVVLDDTFSDLSRANVPVSPSSSLWFASTAASLSDGSTGNLIGTPAAGSSRLWIGYFTDNTSLPVHLAVGTAMKATMVFKANGIVVTNGGTSMRLGLFDYADGGTRVAADGFGSGSTGNGTGVRGYMLTLNYGTVFSANTPESISARNILSDANLMGSAGDFATLGSGPAGATLNGAPAFADDTEYTLEFTVTRASRGLVTVTTSITGSGTNYTTTVNDTAFIYPRFDAFAIRPATAESTAASITISRFKIEVLSAVPSAVPLSVSSAAGTLTLTWSNPAFTLQSAQEAAGPYTDVPGASSPYRPTASGERKFYRLFWSGQ